jgi:hypothetical protein
MLYGDRLLKMRLFSKGILIIFVATFALGLVATAVNPRPEPPMHFSSEISSIGNLANGGSLFSGQTLAMAIKNRPCINCLNPQPEPPPLPISSGRISPVGNLANGGSLFNGQIPVIAIKNRPCISCLNPQPEPPPLPI